MRGNREQRPNGKVLQAYLLGTVDFETALVLQRRLHYDVAGDRDQAALIVCEHQGLITVGRNGSRRHLLVDSAELHARQWRIRWVNRAGGCWLHALGQLNIYPIIPLDAFELTVPEFLAKLGDVVRLVLADFSVAARIRIDDAGVWAGDRLVAALGVAVKDDVAYYGACFNVYPSLDAYRLVRAHPRAPEPMTSLERERRGPVRPAMVRERLVEHFRDTFGFSRVSLFSDHPLLHARNIANCKVRIAN